MYLLAEFDNLVNGIYIQNTLPVSGLGELRAIEIDARRRLWKALATHKRAADPAIADEIRQALALMDRAWAIYLPTGISSEREQNLADELGARLPVFRSVNNPLHKIS